MIPRPRNTLVILDLIPQKDRKVGAIEVPTNKECFCEAIIMAVGPGMISASGGKAETFDLEVGQRVLVKHKNQANGPMGPTQVLTGIDYVVGDKTYYIYNENSILLILADPSEYARVTGLAN